MDGKERRRNFAARKQVVAVGASMLAMGLRAPRLTCKHALSISTIIGSPPGACSFLQSFPAGFSVMTDHSAGNHLQDFTTSA